MSSLVSSRTHLAVKAKITDQLNFLGRIGVGTSFVSQNLALSGAAWESFNPYLRLGLSYTFQKQQITLKE